MLITAYTELAGSDHEQYIMTNLCVKAIKQTSNGIITHGQH